MFLGSCVVHLNRSYLGFGGSALCTDASWEPQFAKILMFPKTTLLADGVNSEKDESIMIILGDFGSIS